MTKRGLEARLRTFGKGFLEWKLNIPFCYVIFKRSNNKMNESCNELYPLSNLTLQQYCFNQQIMLSPIVSNDYMEVEVKFPKI